MYNSKYTDKKLAGFTLVEIIIVMVVIGILLTIGVMSFTSSQNRGKKEQAIAVADKVKLTLGTYYSEKDRYPKEQSVVISYLNTKNQTTTASAFGNTATFIYAGTTASGDACSETGANKCEKYTITVKKTAWRGGASEADVVITP